MNGLDFLALADFRMLVGPSLVAFLFEEASSGLRLCDFCISGGSWLYLCARMGAR